MTDKTTTATPIPTPEQKEQASASITLRGGGSTLTILALRRADGTGTSQVTMTDEKKKSTRGMTQVHGTFEAAKKAIADLAADAQKKGWERRRPVGFARRPDAFAALPMPPAKAATAKGKK